MHIHIVLISVWDRRSTLESGSTQTKGWIIYFCQPSLPVHRFTSWLLGSWSWTVH